MKNNKKYLKSLEYLKIMCLSTFYIHYPLKNRKQNLYFYPNICFNISHVQNPAPVHHTCWSSQVTWSRSTFILNTNTTPTTWKQIELVSDAVIQQHIKLKHVWTLFSRLLRYSSVYLFFHENIFAVINVNACIRLIIISFTNNLHNNVTLSGNVLVR